MIFKHKEDRELFTMVNPILIMIYADLFVYAKANFNKELVVTQTITTLEDDKKLGRVSASHREKRAIDVRTKNLSNKEIKTLVEYINNKWAYKDYRYVSRSGVKRLAYYHNSGHGAHLHIAIHSKFKL